MSIIAIASALLLLYSILLLYYKILWDAVKDVSSNKSFKPKKFVSVIIPARDEEKKIARLLDSIQNQNYPKERYEVIVVDDHSEDETAAIVKSYSDVRYIHLSELVDNDFENSFKKKAISEAIQRASGDLIVTTDADCEVGINWLLSIAQAVEENDYKALAGPVMFFNNNTVLNIFQELDCIAMQGITAAVVSSNKGAMSNGANFIYTKKAFEEVNGFEGIDHLASGDDMMLMYKFMNKFPERVGYLKNPDAIVQTDAMTTLGSFLQQRIRWASKNKSLSDKKIQVVLLLSWLMNAVILVALFSVIQYPDNFILVLLLFIIKGVAEYFFSNDVARFFGRKKRLPFLFILQPLHIIYMTFVGFLGMFNTYTWKRRKVK